MLNITFFGVRGSTPCSGDRTRRYGGNTSCVAVESPGQDPIILDMGTGLRYFGETQPLDGTFNGTALVTHLHWDHVQGLPFFVPVLERRPPVGARAGARQRAEPVRVVRPLRPAAVLPGPDGRVPRHARVPRAPRRDLHGRRRQGDGAHRCRTSARRTATASSGTAPPSPTSPITSSPADGGMSIADGALELCEGADLVIHDAQYTVPEFAMKSTWGHCTVEYAVMVAKEAGAKALALFHHDPTRHDEALDELSACAARVRRPCRHRADHRRGGVDRLLWLKRPTSIPPIFRQVLGHFPTGVTIVTAAPDHKPVGLAVGSFTSVSLDPPLVAFCPCEHVDELAAHQRGRHVLRERPRRGPRRAVSPLRGQGRRQVRGHRLEDEPARLADPRRTCSRGSTARSTRCIRAVTT